MTVTVQRTGHSAEDWCVMTMEDEHAQREEKTKEDSLP